MNKNANSADVRRLTRATRKAGKFLSNTLLFCELFQCPQSFRCPYSICSIRSTGGTCPEWHALRDKSWGRPALKETRPEGDIPQERHPHREWQFNYNKFWAQLKPNRTTVLSWRTKSISGTGGSSRALWKTKVFAGFSICSPLHVHKPTKDRSPCLASFWTISNIIIKKLIHLILLNSRYLNFRVLHLEGWFCRVLFRELLLES